MKITWRPSSKLIEQVVPYPKPARSYLPDWYKKIPAFTGGEKKFNPTNPLSQRSLQLCVPFADSLGSGYIQETWQDILITKIKDPVTGNEGINYHFPSKEPGIISLRHNANIPVSKEFYNLEFVFHLPWLPVLPKGWSMLYVHPLNREDLPFRTMSGIMDNDRYTYLPPNGSNLPFYIENDFEGIIPAGTPMIQMIPIKRESWQSYVEEYDEALQNKITMEINRRFWGGYRKAFWQKKDYK